MDEDKHKMLLYGILGVVGVGIIYFVSQGGGGSVSGPSSSALLTAQANEEALQTHLVETRSTLATGALVEFATLNEKLKEAQLNSQTAEELAAQFRALSEFQQTQETARANLTLQGQQSSNAAAVTEAQASAGAAKTHDIIGGIVSLVSNFFSSI